jgi:hypothetical protein
MEGVDGGGHTEHAAAGGLEDAEQATIDFQIVLQMRLASIGFDG